MESQRVASLRKGDVGAEPQWSREAEKAVPAATGSYLLGAGMWSPPDQRSRAAYSCQSFNTGGSDHGGTPIAPAEGFVLRASQRGAMLLHLPRALIFTTQLPPLPEKASWPPWEVPPESRGRCGAHQHRSSGACLLRPPLGGDGSSMKRSLT